MQPAPAGECTKFPPQGTKKDGFPAGLQEMNC